MPNMHDIGEDRRNPMEPISAPDSERIYQVITLEENKLPFLKGKNVGDTFEADVSFRIVEIREAQEFDSGKENYYRLELKKIGEPEAEPRKS